MKVTICYDIVSTRRRNRVVKVLLGYGYRVQKSVFETVVSKADLLEIQKRLEATIKKSEDSVRYYILCADCDKKIEVQGIGKHIEEIQYIII